MPEGNNTDFKSDAIQLSIGTGKYLMVHASAVNGSPTSSISRFIATPQSDHEDDFLSNLTRLPADTNSYHTAYIPVFGASSESSTSRDFQTPQANQIGSPDDKEQPATTNKNHRSSQIARASLRTGWVSSSIVPLGGMLPHANANSLNLETILWHVRLLYARRNFGHDGQHGIKDQLSQIVMGPQAQFWNELKSGIYFMKISCFERAQPMLLKAGSLASGAFTESPLAFVRELFSTLSPVNTVLCSDLRLCLLRTFFTCAEQSFGNTHPIVILCDELQKDRNSQEVSDRALSFMVDLLISTEGISHDMTFKTQITLIRFLRRSGEYERAAAMARKLLQSSLSLSGHLSLSARMAARELEHILMDQHQWQQALRMCHYIVGQPCSTYGLVQPQSHDECAVHTMEDIAKIFENLGEPEVRTSWLMQAANSAWALWGWCIATTHVFDKLVGALQAAGRFDEAKFWQDIHNAGGNGSLLQTNSSRSTTLGIPACV